jgi:predicted nucleotidyltransferase
MDAEKKIIKTYYEQKISKLYFNQIKDHTKLSNSSLQNSLLALIKKNILQVEKTKGNTFYSIKDKKRIAIYFSEISLEKFENLNLGVKSPLRNFLKDIQKEIHIIILFGSASTKNEQKESDIDLLVVSDEKTDLEKHKKEAEVTSKYPISVFQCSTKQFLEGKDPIIIQAKKTGFPIYGEQKFYEAILDGY